MSEKVVREIVDKAIEDEKFRKLLFNNPDKALADYDLTDKERQTLRDLDEGDLDSFAGSLGQRTTKGVIPGIGSG